MYRLDADDLLLVMGILAFLAMSKVEGIKWAVETFLVLFVNLTFFNWIRKKIIALENAKKYEDYDSY